MLLPIVPMLWLGAYSLARINGWEHDDPGTRFEGDKCNIITGEVGTCTLIDKCTVYINALKNKTIAYSSLKRCSFVGHTEVICCPDPPEVDPSKAPPLVRPSTSSHSLKDTHTTEESLIDVRIGPPTPKARIEIFQSSDAERPSQAACRYYSELNPANLNYHILDGVPVNPGDFPHMGGLLFPSGAAGTDYELNCGCTLISDQYVMTAAHCVNDPLRQPTKVRFGVVIWNRSLDGNMPVDIEVENVTTHDLYRSRQRHHDIALIKLRTPVEYSPFIRPACLHADKADIDSSVPLVVIGWGLTDVKSKARSDVLLMTNVSTVPMQRCSALHRSYAATSSLDEGQYCASDPELKKDSCEADSGSPLQLVSESGSDVVGIVSYGNLCATAIPSVYTRVAFYLDWIESIVWPS